jgi:hypothetical protein
MLMRSGRQAREREEGEEEERTLRPGLGRRSASAERVGRRRRLLPSASASSPSAALPFPLASCSGFISNNDLLGSATPNSQSSSGPAHARILRILDRARARARCPGRCSWRGQRVNIFLPVCRPRLPCPA